MLTVRVPTGKAAFALLDAETPAERATAREAMRAAGLARLPLFTFVVLGPSVAEMAPTGDWLEAAG